MNEKTISLRQLKIMKRLREKNIEEANKKFDSYLRISDDHVHKRFTNEERERVLFRLNCELSILLEMIEYLEGEK